MKYNDQRRNELLAKIERLQEESLPYRQQQGNSINSEGQQTLLDNVVRSYNFDIAKLNIEFQQLEKLRLAEYRKSDTHQSLMATSGLNGSQILILNSKKSA